MPTNLPKPPAPPLSELKEAARRRKYTPVAPEIAERVTHGKSTLDRVAAYDRMVEDPDYRASHGLTGTGAQLDRRLGETPEVYHRRVNPKRPIQRGRRLLRSNR